MPFGKKTLKGKKEPFQKDKAQKNNQTGHHDNDNRLRVEERNPSNRYNNSGMNRVYKSHPRYQPGNPKKPYITCKTISLIIINLSKQKLCKPELSLLCRGPKFTPTSKGNNLNLKSDIFNFTRCIQMQETFYGQDDRDESLVSDKSNKQFKSKNLELQHLVKSIESIETEYKPFNSNISKDEQEALQKLKQTKTLL